MIRTSDGMCIIYMRVYDVFAIDFDDKNGNRKNIHIARETLASSLLLLVKDAHEKGKINDLDDLLSKVNCICAELREHNVSPADFISILDKYGIYSKPKEQMYKIDKLSLAFDVDDN